jgi:hypothetical protein
MTLFGTSISIVRSVRQTVLGLCSGYCYPTEQLQLRARVCCKGVK